MSEKKQVIKGYKGFKKDMKCRDFQYEVGKTYTHDGSIEICEAGFHFCLNILDVNNFYSIISDNHVFCEIEAIGTVKHEDDQTKSVTDKIKIVRVIPKDELMQMCNDGEQNIGLGNTGGWNTGNRNTGDKNTGDKNTGNSNTGNWNTGDFNTGDRNIGYWNTGDRNIGYWNTGDRNTGYKNTGNRNAGYWNIGNWNVGNRNIGYWNTGNRNTGDKNTGDKNTGNRNAGYWNIGNWNVGDNNTGDFNTGNGNTGDRNTGYRNTGDWNTGDWNKTDYATGVFCNKKQPLILFNKKTTMTRSEWRGSKAYNLLYVIKYNKWIYTDDMTEQEKNENPSYKTTGGYLKAMPRAEASKQWWDDLSDTEKDIIFNIPNFNLKVFNDIMELEITQKEYKEIYNYVNN